MLFVMTMTKGSGNIKKLQQTSFIWNSYCFYCLKFAYSPPNNLYCIDDRLTKTKPTLFNSLQPQKRNNRLRAWNNSF